MFQGDIAIISFFLCQLVAPVSNVTMLYVMGPNGRKHTHTNGAIIVIADEQIRGN